MTTLSADGRMTLLFLKTLAHYGSPERLREDLGRRAEADPTWRDFLDGWETWNNHSRQLDAIETGPASKGVLAQVATKLVQPEQALDAVSSQVETKPEADNGDAAVFDFLRAQLAQGPQSVRDLERAAQAAGVLGPNADISQSKAMRRARQALNISCYQMKGRVAGGWFWSIDGQESAQSTDGEQMASHT